MTGRCAFPCLSHSAPQPIPVQPPCWSKNRRNSLLDLQSPPLNNVDAGKTDFNPLTIPINKTTSAQRNRLENSARRLDGLQAISIIKVSVPSRVRPPATVAVESPSGETRRRPGCKTSRPRDLSCRSALPFRAPRHRFFPPRDKPATEQNVTICAHGARKPRCQTLNGLRQFAAFPCEVRG